MTLTGAIGFDKNFVIMEEGGDSKKADIYGFITLAGLVMDIASIPVFISASKNKKRAISLETNSQIPHYPLRKQASWQCQSIPALTMKINF